MKQEEHTKNRRIAFFALLWSMIRNCNPNLFENGNPDKVIPPSLGMNVGDFEYQDSGIQYWIKSFCFAKHKACVYGKDSKASRKVFVCTDSKCCWRIAISRGSSQKRGRNWTVTQYEEKHTDTCTSNRRDCNLSHKEIAKMMPGHGDKISKETAKDQVIKSSLPLIHKSSRFYQRMARAQELNGKDNFHFSFGYLKAQLESLRELNPGSVTNLESVVIRSGEEETNRFLRCAVSLAGNIATAPYCRPVVSFDAGALKHQLWAGYQVMVAGMMDGENHDVLLGIAIVPSEDTESYRYFIQCLKQHETMRAVFSNPDLVVITDRGTALIAAIESEFPLAHHRCCAMHLLGNVPSPKMSEEGVYLYWKIVKSSTRAEFEQLMERLKRKHPNAHAYLSVVPPKQWCNFGQPKSSWGQLTNNMAERGVKALGSDVDNARKLNACQMINRYTTLQQARFDKARERMAKWTTTDPLCPIARGMFDKEFELAQDYDVSDGATSINVNGRECKTYTVYHPIDVRVRAVGYDDSSNLSEDRQKVQDVDGRLTCTCVTTQYIGVPCRHICAVHQVQNTVEGLFNNLPTLVHACMLKANLRFAYGTPIHDNFESSNRWAHDLMQGPPPKDVSKTLLGKRIRSKSAKHTGASGRVLKKCSICGKTCHKAGSCPLRNLSEADRSRTLADERLQIIESRRDIIVAELPLLPAASFVEQTNNEMLYDGNDDVIVEVPHRPQTRLMEDTNHELIDDGDDEIGVEDDEFDDEYDTYDDFEDPRENDVHCNIDDEEEDGGSHSSENNSIYIL